MVEREIASVQTISSPTDSNHSHCRSLSYQNRQCLLAFKNNEADLATAKGCRLWVWPCPRTFTSASGTEFTRNTRILKLLASVALSRCSLRSDGLARDNEDVIHVWLAYSCVGGPPAAAFYALVPSASRWLAALEGRRTRPEVRKEALYVEQSCIASGCKAFDGEKKKGSTASPRSGSSCGSRESLQKRSRSQSHRIEQAARTERKNLRCEETL